MAIQEEDEDLDGVPTSERKFPYGDCVILKSGYKTPLDNLRLVKKDDEAGREASMIIEQILQGITGSGKEDDANVNEGDAQGDEADENKDSEASEGEENDEGEEEDNDEEDAEGDEGEIAAEGRAAVAAIIEDIVPDEDPLKTLADETEREQTDLKVYFESSILYTKNPQNIAEECLKSEDPYDDDMAEVKYLYSKPAGFIVVGKPSPDNFKLGQKLAAHWGCLFLDPITCLQSERNINSPALKWCQEHLAEGKSIPSGIVMRIMEQHALSDEAVHRGFVICGLPYASEGPDDPSVHEQLGMIFSWPVDPKILIYVTCPDNDMTTKSKQMCYDSTTGHFINKNVFSIDKEVHLVFSLDTRISSGGSVIDDVYKEIEQEKTLVSENDVKHLVVIPEPNLKYNLLRYQQSVLPGVEQYTSQLHPQYVIRVDGRTTPAHMLRIVKARLQALSLQPVFQPMTMLKINYKEHKKAEGKEQTEENESAEMESERKEEEFGEEVGEEEDELPFDFGSPDEAYQQLCAKEAASVRFKWQKSNWGYYCPVALSSGIVVEGQAKYAVRFLDKMYFLSSLENLTAFVKNPRLYLIPPNPKPSCKFIVVGHKLAGKSALCSFLAHAFQGKVIRFPSSIEEEQQKNIEANKQTQVQSVALGKISEINKKRKEEYDNAEKIRMENVQKWQSEQINAMNQLDIPEYDEDNEVLEDMFPPIPEEDEDKATGQEAGVEAGQGEGLEAGQGAEQQTGQTEEKPFNLDEPLVPQLSFARCRWLLGHPDDLLKYLPLELALPTPFPKAADESDPEVKEFLESAEKPATEGDEPKVTPQTKAALAEVLKDVQNEKATKLHLEKSEGGWVIDDFPLDPELWQHLVDEGLVPEVVISLQDQSPEYTFLKEKMTGKAAQPNPNEPDQTDKDDDKKEAPEPNPELDKYVQELKEFDEKWTSLQNSIIATHPPIIVNIADKTTDELLIDVLQSIEGLYHVAAKPFTDEDRAEERYGSRSMEDVENEEEEQMGEREYDTEDIHKIRKMGDTMTYCPVAFQSNRTLWTGKDNLLAKYKGKVYTFSNEESMEKFLQNPWRFGPFHKSEEYLPPLRICIAGPVGSGKTSVGKLLARALGLIHKDLEDHINKTLLPKSEPVGRKVRYLKTQDKEKGIKEKDGEEKKSQATEDSQEDPEKKGEEDAAIKEEEDQQNLRDSIEQYLTQGTPVPETLVPNVLTPLWYEEPYHSTGLVLSGFPLHPDDFDIMKEHYLIPDVIIGLSIRDEQTAKERLIKEMKERKEKEAEKRRRKSERAKILAGLDETGEMSSVALDMKQYITALLDESGSEEGSEELMHGQNEVKDISENEGSEEGEFNDDLRMQYEEDIQEWFSADKETLENIRTLAAEENIRWLDAKTDNIVQDVCLRIMHDIQDLKQRSSVVLEQSFPITSEEAEHLLKSGYYFLSRFGRWCPVQLATKDYPVQLYEPMNQKAEIFPVIHRRFIYFLGGQENRNLFVKDPLQYIRNAQPKPLVPMKIAIIGPPKCGKSTLARRLSKEWNIKVITIGQSIRYVLEDLSWTDLATSVQHYLKAGEIVPASLALRCVEAATIDPRSAEHGYVFDGFPITDDQIYEMASLNLIPYIVIALNSTLSTCCSRLQSEIATFFSRTPVFSAKLLQYKYRNWIPVSSLVEKHLNNKYHNLVFLEAAHILWWLYEKSVENIFYVMRSISNYYDAITIDKPGKLECMCITPNEFIERQSQYLNYCPACLQEGHLNSAGISPDKMGLVQYQEYFYWFCPAHMNSFLTEPSQYISPQNTSTVPFDVPYIPTDDDDDEYEIAEDGYCIVCYINGLPKRILVKGLEEYPAIYKGKKYLFADAVCRNKFLSDVSQYGDRKVCKLGIKNEQLSVRKFPTLGFLEQTVSTYIHSALLEVGSQRPKYPGLSLTLSAALFIGYYLKLINPQTTKAQGEMFRGAQEEFLFRCKILKKLCAKNNIRNPLLTHPKPSTAEKNVDTIVDRLIDNIVK